MNNIYSSPFNPIPLLVVAPGAPQATPPVITTWPLIVTALMQMLLPNDPRYMQWIANVGRVLEPSTANRVRFDGYFWGIESEVAQVAWNVMLILHKIIMSAFTDTEMEWFPVASSSMRVPTSFSAEALHEIGFIPMPGDETRRIEVPFYHNPLSHLARLRFHTREDCVSALRHHQNLVRSAMCDFTRYVEMSLQKGSDAIINWGRPIGLPWLNFVLSVRRIALQMEAQRRGVSMMEIFGRYQVRVLERSVTGVEFAVGLDDPADRTYGPYGFPFYPHLPFIAPNCTYCQRPYCHYDSCDFRETLEPPVFNDDLNLYDSDSEYTIYYTDSEDEDSPDSPMPSLISASSFDEDSVDEDTRLAVPTRIPRTLRREAHMNLTFQPPIQHPSPIPGQLRIAGVPFFSVDDSDCVQYSSSERSVNGNFIRGWEASAFVDDPNEGRDEDGSWDSDDEFVPFFNVETDFA
ncbi:hypothetical protein CYLTODRAFT_460141 [Cylindrobasidium torrendii FP15055 ss-10]|uniref:Uncharacterized protein n=1 Tax=Cylindrobasidium torrendii FP15055 ss-10 TaxID=1314674 RepID=A0A0D7AUY2_9AGAR|nr:hypothetical protein CYLTODRAFT_460141 [Cylindrobasidium torrendii FP15055 ss-10]